MMRMAATLAVGVPPVAGSPIRWVPPEVDDWGVTTIGFYGGWAVQIEPRPLSYRLQLAEPGEGGQPWYAWYYRKGPAAHLAALAWNPDLDGEPPGGRRVVGQPRPAGLILRRSDR